MKCFDWFSTFYLFIDMAVSQASKSLMCHSLERDLCYYCVDLIGEFLRKPEKFIVKAFLNQILV